MHQRGSVGLASVGVLSKLLLTVRVFGVKRGTRLQRSRSPARSLRQLKYATTDTDNKHR